MTLSILSITGNKTRTAYKVTIHAYEWLTIKFFTYWPNTNRLTAPKVRLGKFYHPIFEMPLSVERELCQQIQEYITEHPDVPVEEAEEEPKTPETPQGGQPIPQAEEKPRKWDSLKKADGSYWKRERFEDDTKGNMIEITEADYLLLNPMTISVDNQE